MSSSNGPSGLRRMPSCERHRGFGRGVRWYVSQFSRDTLVASYVLIPRIHHVLDPGTRPLLVERQLKASDAGCGAQERQDMAVGETH